MATSPLPPTTEAAPALPSALERPLPSGRSVVLRIRGTTEELEVRSPAGDVELRVTLGPDGPVLHLRAARLELEAADTVTLDCRRFEVAARDEICLTGQEMRVRTEGDIHLNGDVIHLNC